jgi:hypothetical protein
LLDRLNRHIISASYCAGAERGSSPLWEGESLGAD